MMSNNEHDEILLKNNFDAIAMDVTSKEKPVTELSKAFISYFNSSVTTAEDAAYAGKELVSVAKLMSK